MQAINLNNKNFDELFPAEMVLTKITLISPGRALDDLLPFFLDRDKNDIFEEHGYSSKEAAMGVPIHYRNDGSFMYILTPVNSPPSKNSVRQWLTSGQGGDNQNSTGHMLFFFFFVSVIFFPCFFVFFFF